MPSSGFYCSLTDWEDENSWRHHENANEPIGHGQAHDEQIGYGPQASGGDDG